MGIACAYFQGGKEYERKAGIRREEAGICRKSQGTAGGDRKAILESHGLTGVRVLVRYDIENISEDIYKEALGTIFSEPPVDDVYEGSFPHGADDVIFSVEYLPGQFDQRADSAEQCVKLVKRDGGAGHQVCRHLCDFRRADGGAGGGGRSPSASTRWTPGRHRRRSRRRW